MLNYYLLAASISIVLASIIFLFYWNRIVARLLAFILRVYLWNQDGFSSYIHIGSIHFSLLTGRLMVKTLRYYSSNQTIKLVKGEIIWRYWIWRPATEDDIGFSISDGSSKRTSSCRIHVALHGLEWFLYNRTAAYDNIISQMDPSLDPFTSTEEDSTNESASHLSAPGSTRFKAPEWVLKTMSWFRQQLPNLDPKDLLPIGIDVTEGAIICGNTSTPSLLVSEFRRSGGTFGVVPSKSKHDLYKQVLTLNFQKPVIRYIPNTDHRDPMVVVGEHVYDEMLLKHLEPITSHILYLPFRKIWRKLGLYGFAMNRPRHRTTYSHPVKSKGSKSTDAGYPTGRLTELEYATEYRILEAPLLEISYYVDTAGVVPPLPHASGASQLDMLDIGNGDAGPEWGVELIIHRGTLRYGPWSDRQRAELQKAFFPATYQKLRPTKRLEPGDSRVWTAMRVFVELRDETTLLIPFKEASKNWQWEEVELASPSFGRRPGQREAAILSVTTGDRSAISYIMPMVAGPSGYNPELEVHLDTVTVASSLNDIRLLSAESCRIRCELPSPLAWNDERTWTVGITLRQPVLYLLRDHINMFTDLGKDWSSGPPADYQRFVPMTYAIDMDLHHYQLNLYANDHNIIDKPLAKEENATFTLHGAHLRSAVILPSTTFRPEFTDVSYSVNAPLAMLNLSLPRWNMNALHLPKEGNNIAKVDVLSVKGSYLYYADVQDGNIDQLTLEISAQNLAFKLLGWSIRYFMILRENYFGSFTHFSTLSEYLEKRKEGLPLGDPLSDKHKSNMMQVELSVSLEDGTVMLPAGLPGYDKSCTGTPADTSASTIGPAIIFSIPELQVHLRLHDYFMELGLNSDTLLGWVDHNCTESLEGCLKRRRPKEILLLDGIDIVANRLFGPLPRTLTYVCLWEIRLASIKALLNAQDASLLAAAGKAFVVNFDDKVNTPADEFVSELLPDLTFVNLAVRSIDVTWRTGPAALVVSIPNGVQVNHNDLGGDHHKKLTTLRVPHVITRVLLSPESEQRTWLETTSLECDINVDVYGAPLGWRDVAVKQALFIREQDYPTGRFQRMFSKLKARHSSIYTTSPAKAHMAGVYIPRPMLSSYKQYDPLTTDQDPAAFLRIPQWEQAYHSSASEGEEGLSEAERDAFVARTRSETPLRKAFSYADDDEDMASGDESDNEDLTDAESSDTDHSDYEGPISQTSKIPFKMYSRYLRHFTPHRAQRLSGGQGSFVLVKRHHAMDGPDLRSDVGHGSFKLKHSAPHDDTKEVTLLKVRCRKTLALNLTPLAASALPHFLQDAETVASSPELWLDSLISQYISDFQQSQSQTRRSIDLQLPLTCVNIFQCISLPTASKPLDSPSLYSTRASSVRAATMLRLDGLQLTGGADADGLLLSTTVDEVSLEVFSDFVAHASPPILSGDAISSIRLKEIGSNLTTDNVEMSCGAIELESSHRAPELLTAIIGGWTKPLKTVKGLHRRWSTHKKRGTVAMLDFILTSTHYLADLDPLSAIQPLYLVQTGTPHALRTDATFRFLFHLRDCLWHVGQRNIQDPPPTAQEHAASLEDLGPALESRLVNLDPEASFDDLRTVFGKVKTKETDVPKSHAANYVAIHLRTLTMVILDPEAALSSQLTINNVAIRGNLQTAQLTETDQRSMSQTSLLQRSVVESRHVRLSFAVGESVLTIFPHLLNFAQEVLRVRRVRKIRRHAKRALSVSRSTRIKGLRPQPVTKLDLIFSWRNLQIQAAASNLTFEFGLSGFRIVTSLLLHDGQAQAGSMAHSLLFRHIFIRAVSPVDRKKRSDQDILASFILTNCRLNAIGAEETAQNSKIRIAGGLGGIHFTVPRSVLKLYRFIEEWRADFIPGIEATAKALLAEVQQAPHKSPSPTPSLRPSTRLSVLFNFIVESAGISFQVMHGTWLSWEVQKTVLHANSQNLSQAPTVQIFAMRTASQMFCISSTASAKESDKKTRVKLVLPPLSISGSVDGKSITANAMIDFFDLKVKPTHWDTLLAVQQKFGQDFNDLVALVQETRKGRPHTTQQQSAPSSMRWDVFAKMRGFRIGLEGSASTFFFECVDISGRFNSTPHPKWGVSLSDLALSLASKTDSDLRNLDRVHRSAFVIIDMNVTGTNAAPDISPQNDHLDVSITKVQAVMQPSSIGEVGDFLDDMQVELTERREKRAAEMAAFKLKTQRILQTFDVKPSADMLESSERWLDHYVIDFSIHNVGVAFPLTHSGQLLLPRSTDSTTVRAFLFSIRSISFATQHGQTGQASMKNLSFQFVPRFRQSVGSDFAGESHHTRNRLIYPSMTAQLRTAGTVTARQVYVWANVSGFILEVDSSIPDYVFSLIDVYRKGKERMEMLAASMPRSPEAPTESTKVVDSPYLASNFFGSFSFQSGQVRMYSARLSRTDSTTPILFDAGGDKVMNMGAEVFNLPVLSVWAEYRASPKRIASTRPHPSTEPSILMFKTTIHSSQNTLRPTLLPFLTELLGHVETRLRSVEEDNIPSPIDRLVTEPDAEVSMPVISSMQISFAIRIDQSKLELTCQPDVNVIAGLHWDSGGFVINVSPGARKVTFSGAVAGLNVGLKHGFLSEDCVKLDARNLNLSVTFAKMGVDQGDAVSFVSLVLDTEFHGSARFSRLQDMLCFKAVWLDHIPVLGPPTTAGPPLSAKAVVISEPHRPVRAQFTNVVLVRIRRITLDVDLGQSISTLGVNLTDAVLRTKITEDSSELLIEVGNVAILGQGNVSGQLDVSNCCFETVRRKNSDNPDGHGHLRTLELRMTSGALVAAVESEHEKLLRYRAEPLEVEIYDDWSNISPNSKEEPLRLSFTVVSPEIVAVVTVSAIPKLLSYANKFTANLEAQREGASRESQTFRASRTPKPDNPLSAVAEAMIHSARSQFKEETGLDYFIRQNMTLKLQLLRLVVFPRTMGDSEAAQFIARRVHARLDRLVRSDTVPAKRDIHLSFKTMVISRFNQLGHAMPLSPDLHNNSQEWLDVLFKDAKEENVVGLPSMVMQMASEEAPEDERRILLYDFHSKFVRHQGAEHFGDDIYITLNVSLYSWLTLLRKTFTREMNQVSAAADWRATKVMSPQPVGPTRKKIPEPLHLNLESSSSALLSPLSALSPRQRSSLPPIASGRSMLSSQLASSVSSRFGGSSTVPSTPAAVEQHQPPSAMSANSQLPALRSFIYRPRVRQIERLTMRQLGEATPDVMHPFFMKKAGFSLEDALPQYVNEYATTPLEEIMQILLKLYSKQLLVDKENDR